MQKFKDILRVILKPEYLLPDKVIDSNAIAGENLKYDSDYILLEYIIHNRRIQIQDGKAMYIGIFPVEDSNTKPLDLAEYVKSVAVQTMNLPKADKNGNELYVRTSSRDIGSSRCGIMRYGPEFLPYQSWHYYIQWWSDGRNVLFAIGKLSFDGVDYSKMPHLPKIKPRKFKKKTKD